MPRRVIDDVFPLYVDVRLSSTRSLDVFLVTVVLRESISVHTPTSVAVASATGGDGLLETGPPPGVVAGDRLRPPSEESDAVDAPSTSRVGDESAILFYFIYFRQTKNIFFLPRPFTLRERLAEPLAA